MIYVRKTQIPALPTREPRRLYVYLPKGYRTGEQRYPVLYMFDGHNVFYDSHATYGKSWGMKEYLERSGAKIILVAVECNPEGNRRLNEYTPWTFRCPLGTIESQGRETMDWFTQVLKPEIDHRYRTLPDRAHTAIAGSSMGGLMSLYAAVAYNDVFSRAAALSPSLWVSRTRMKELIGAHPLREPTRIYLDVGTGEIEGRREALAAVFETAKQLSVQGADVSANVIPDALHNEAAWEKRIPVFFEYLMHDMTEEPK